MTRRRCARRASMRLAVLAVVAVATAAGAEVQPRRRPLENVKILKGWTGDEVRAEMRLMAEALGVKCEHCHVQGNFPSDEKRTKQTARRMIALTQSLNADYFADAATPAEGASKFGRVTCYTCHQGAATPKQSGTGVE